VSPSGSTSGRVSDARARTVCDTDMSVDSVRSASIRCPLCSVISFQAASRCATRCNSSCRGGPASLGGPCHGPDPPDVASSGGALEGSKVTRPMRVRMPGRRVTLVRVGASLGSDDAIDVSFTGKRYVLEA